MTIPVTVIGGYLGAGKTTLLNRILRDPGGRRLAVVVNDFGDIGIDAELLARTAQDADGRDDPTDVINLANGCVCCTLGDDLGTTLRLLTERTPPPDHIVIEASGVADPVAIGAWGRVPPFEPGGIVVLAAVDTVRRQVDDRYVGPEVRRQLAGADLIVVTKTDLVDDAVAARCTGWLVETFGRPVVIGVRGSVPVDVVLGVDLGELDGEGDIDNSTRDSMTHSVGYESWSWRGAEPITRGALESWLAALPPALLRVKGIVLLDEGGWAVVDVVGDQREITEHPSPGAGATSARTPEFSTVIGARFVAIAPAGRLDRAFLDDVTERYCAADDHG